MVLEFTVCKNMVKSILAICLVWLAACEEGRRLVVRALDENQIEFSVEDMNGNRSGCIWSLSVFEVEGRQETVWNVGLDEGAPCRSSITAPIPPPGYSSLGAPEFLPERSYEVQAFGPGFNVLTTFKRSELQQVR